MNDQIEENVENPNILADDNYEYYDKNDDKDEVTKEKDETQTKAIKLLELPIEELPCPKELMRSIEESYGHPIQNEIRLKAFSNVLRNLPNFILIFIMTMLV